jgi:hypothetical protein
MLELPECTAFDAAAVHAVLSQLLQSGLLEELHRYN